MKKLFNKVFGKKVMVKVQNIENPDEEYIIDEEAAAALFAEAFNDEYRIIARQENGEWHNIK